MLLSSAYRTKRCPRRSNSRSSSSSTRLLNSGESGPPWGVPSTLGLTNPFSITPAFRNARMSFNSRLSSTRFAICPISPHPPQPPAATFKRLYQTRAEHLAQLHVFLKRASDRALTLLGHNRQGDLPELSPKSGSTDAKTIRSNLRIALTLLQHLFDELLFQRCQGTPGQECQSDEIIFCPGQIRGQMPLFDFVPLAFDESVFDDVFQLSDVAGVGVLHQKLHRVR